MKIRRILLFILLIILFILILALAWGYFGAVRPARPQLEGEVTLPGLTAAVTIYRDAYGIPYIYAANAHDLFMAQGYVHAQDRLWQMESARRAGHGRLSELVGENGLRTDRFMRTLGMSQAAAADWETLDDETQAALEAYAAGVNVFIDQADGRLPLEFKILGFAPEPWTPQDSLVFGKLLAWSLSNNYANELLQAKLVAELGWETALELTPPYTGPYVIPDANAQLDSNTATALLRVSSNQFSVFSNQFSVFSNQYFGLPTPDQGSNNWVVSGERTANGRPLLANDPHQSLPMPGFWYEVGLRTADGRYDVAGGSLPGVPGVEIGHNARIAWGVTNARPDVQDLFIETIAAGGAQYEFMGEQRPLDIRVETIRVKDAEPVELTVRSTHHGPIISDVIEDAADDLALRWTALDGRPLMQAILELNRAGNFDEFRAALRYWEVPAMHFVYADVDGHIGYQMPGAVPIRASNPGQSLAPVDGAGGEFEWVGWIPYEELPTDLDPSGDFYVTANTKPVGDDYPYFIAHFWQPNYRLVRISDQLRQADGLTPADFETMQADYDSRLNAQLARLLVTEAAPLGELAAAAQTLLIGWDGQMTAHSPAAAITEVAFLHLLRQVLSPRLGEEGVDVYLEMVGYPEHFMQKLMDEPDNVWWAGNRAGLLASALETTATELAGQFGDDPRGWEWGRLHTITFAHPLGSVGALAPIFNRGPFPVGGNWVTVNSGAYWRQESYDMAIGPAYRVIFDVGDWDNSRTAVPTGQSGQPFTPHYDDGVRAWLYGGYHPLPFSRDAVEAAAEYTLTLSPGE